jgi:hypothetical protein
MWSESLGAHNVPSRLVVSFCIGSWSGGYQLFTGVKGGCNMMRVVSLHPEDFSKHFIYHVANNKQKQLTRRRMVRADHLWAQLNSVKKAAEKEKARLLQSGKIATTA